MNLFSLAKDQILTSLTGLVPNHVDLSKVSVDQPRDPSHGDLATNAAMVVAKPAGLPPRELADQLAKRLSTWDLVDVAEVAGPGFINIRLKNQAWHDLLRSIASVGETYGHSEVGASQGVNVEYVSANPTGPLHMGHVRGAIIGDTLARMLAAVGFNVTREYYVNDAGNQVRILAETVHLRYRELFGETVEIPEGSYGGLYIIEVAEALRERDADKWLSETD